MTDMIDVLGERPARPGDVGPLTPSRVRVDSRVMGTKNLHRWTLTFEVEEDADHCEMIVHLDAGDRSLSGRGRSRRNPSDPEVPQIGEELAAARALHDLANHLINDAWDAIERFETGKQTAG